MSCKEGPVKITETRDGDESTLGYPATEHGKKTRKTTLCSFNLDFILRMRAARVNWKSQLLLIMPGDMHSHHIEWDDAAVINQASRHKELLVRGALDIQTVVVKDSLNRDGGVELHDCM